MPQLGLQGLSEHWLLKEAGDRHWQQLAALRGQRPGSLRDAQGRRVYAAFSHVHLAQAQLHTVQEDDSLHWQLQGGPAGRTRHHSRQRVLGSDGRPLAQLDLLSAFVARERAGDNHSVLRVPLVTASAAGHAPTASHADAAAHLCLQAARLARAGGWRVRFGLAEAWADLAEGVPASPLPSLAQLCCRPCPHNDFNGAGLLYFASFQAWADRAHWAWGLSDGRRPLRERELAFHGNLNPGEVLHLHLRACQPAPEGGDWTWTQALRANDGRVVADIATWRG
jgi:probable biosynthetic protein (TIGR04099 family)